jgi:class 3 adenylate cyclase
VTQNRKPPKERTRDDYSNRLAELALSGTRLPEVNDVEALSALNEHTRWLTELNARDHLVHEFLKTSSLNEFMDREELKNQIAKLRKDIAEKVEALRKAEATKSQRDDEIREITEINEQLRKKEDLRHLLDRVHPLARKRLLEDEEFRAPLSAGEECNAFVMSVDIRRSTELMLKAREPAQFAEFITSVCEELFNTVIDNNGVFDKFTGDGILAFFPDKFSGEDAAYHAIKAAAESHRIFDRIYKSSRRSFSSVLKGVGLGIGIDFGRVRLLKVAEGLTVVGAPVAYACRLSGAPAGRTLLNQPALDMVEERYRRYVNIEETSIEIKHEGEIVAYDASTNHVAFSPILPAWRQPA